MQLLHSREFSAAAPDPKVQSLAGKISEEGLRGCVVKIARPRHFLSDAEQNRATAEWLTESLRSLDYSVELQGESRNIVALPKELKPGATVPLVGAHYDSVPGSPGADDNGSAVAALLGCAGALARSEAAAIFVAFNREEDGFIGSSEFVEQFVQQNKLRIGCGHILEMVGYASAAPGSQRRPTALPIRLPETGDFLGLLANDQSATAMRQVLELSRAYVPELPVTGLTVVPGAERVFPVLARSDHVPFWRDEIPALMWTDTAEFRNPNYHQASDLPETLDYRFLKSVTQLLTAAVASAASGVPD